MPAAAAKRIGQEMRHATGPERDCVIGSDAVAKAQPDGYTLLVQASTFVTSPKRISFLPNVPTVAESGLAGFDMVSWYGLWGPANLPKNLSAKLSADKLPGIGKDVDDAIRRMNPAVPEEAREAALRLLDRVRPMCQTVDRY